MAQGGRQRFASRTGSIPLASPFFLVSGESVLRRRGSRVPTNSLGTALRKLKEREAFAEEAERLAEIGTYVHDPVLKEALWSPQMKRIFGIAPDEDPVPLEMLVARIHPEDRGRFLAVLSETATSGQKSEMEYRIVRPDGELRYIHGRGELVSVEDPDYPLQVGTVRDITERRKAEAMIMSQAALLRAKEAELLALSTREDKAKIAATLAHELNQPLTAMTFYAAALKQLDPPVEADDRRHELLRALEENALRAGDIVKRLRESVHHRHHRGERFTAEQLVSEAVRFATIGCEGVTFDLDVADAKIEGVDRVQIQQVLVNLIRNACQAGGDRSGARVAIRAERIAKPAPMLHVSVADNGPGVDPGLLPLVFEEGVTTKETGMGLGLSISRTIVEAHGGRMWAENLAQGARFTFEIPDGGHKG
jgi:two-component system, LuxR family, sensor kinase FixL